MISDDKEELCTLATIANRRGLHARAAAKVVKLMESYSADLTICKDDMEVSARSIMGLMMLAATQGTLIRICASGNDAALAMQDLTELIKRRFDEE